MPYNFRIMNRQDQLPREVWLHIFSLLKADPRPSDWQMYHYDKPTNYNFAMLKTVSLVSKTFNEVVKELIWKLPRLKHPLSLKQLKEVVAMGVPIREMKLSHFVFTRGHAAEKEIKEIVDYISNNMHLNAFYLDQCIEEDDVIRSGGNIPLDTFKYCLKNLPIRKINMECFSFNPDTQQFHEYLLSLGVACPEITLSRLPHLNLDRDTKDEMDYFVATHFPDSFRRALGEQRIDEERMKKISGRSNKCKRK